MFKINPRQTEACQLLVHSFKSNGKSRNYARVFV